MLVSEKWRRTKSEPLSIYSLLHLTHAFCLPTWDSENTAVFPMPSYRGADKSLARLGRKQATATEDFEFHISYL